MVLGSEDMLVCDVCLMQRNTRIEIKPISLC